MTEGTVKREWKGQRLRRSNLNRTQILVQISAVELPDAKQANSPSATE